MLNQTKDTFLDDLSLYVKEANPTILLDYLGGELPAQILQKMPRYSKMVSIGNLTRSPVPLNTDDLRWAAKSVLGFAVFNWLEEISPEEKLKWLKYIGADIDNGAPIFGGSAIVKEVSLDDWEAVLNDSEAAASDGKYLIRL